MARLSFWHITLKDIIIIICSAAIPVALAIYSSIMHKQEEQVEEKARQADLNRTLSLRQQQLYDQFIDNIYKLHKNGYLAENQTPWAFANAFYRSAHRKWDPVRKADVLLFLKEQNLIARSICSANCERKDKPDIIRLEKLNFEHVRLLSQTGSLAAVDLQCITFDQVLFNGAVFSSVNLNGVSFIGGQSKHVLIYTTVKQYEQAIFVNCKIPSDISDKVKLRTTRAPNSMNACATPYPQTVTSSTMTPGTSPNSYFENSKITTQNDMRPTTACPPLFCDFDTYHSATDLYPAIVERIYLNCTGVLSNLTATITVKRTFNASFHGQHNTFGNTTVEQYHRNSSTEIVYIWKSIPNQVIYADGSMYDIEAHFKTESANHTVNNDTYNITFQSSCDRKFFHLYGNF